MCSDPHSSFSVLSVNNVASSVLICEATEDFLHRNKDPEEDSSNAHLMVVSSLLVVIFHVIANVM